MNKEQFQQFCLVQAQWWMHSASNGHAATRYITRGDGHRLTADELRDDAMNISRQHMTNFRKSCDGEY